MDPEHPHEEFEEPAKPGKGPRMTTNKVKRAQRGLFFPSNWMRDTYAHYRMPEKSRELLHKRKRQEQKPRQGCTAQIVAREEWEWESQSREKEAVSNALLRRLIVFRVPRFSRMWIIFLPPSLLTRYRRVTLDRGRISLCFLGFPHPLNALVHAPALRDGARRLLLRRFRVALHSVLHLSVFMPSSTTTLRGTKLSLERLLLVGLLGTRLSSKSRNATR